MAVGANFRKEVFGNPNKRKCLATVRSTIPSCRRGAAKLPIHIPCACRTGLSPPLGARLCWRPPRPRPRRLDAVAPFFVGGRRRKARDGGQAGNVSDVRRSQTGGGNNNITQFFRSADAEAALSLTSNATVACGGVGCSNGKTGRGRYGERPFLKRVLPTRWAARQVPSKKQIAYSANFRRPSCLPPTTVALPTYFSVLTGGANARPARKEYIS